MKAARILVVDDNAELVRVVSEALAREGFVVTSTTSPREALNAATDGLEIDLILSDVVMPEMSGPELVRNVQQHSPSVAAVLMSGFVSENLPRGIPFIEKPFTAARLVSVITMALKKAGMAPS